MKKYMLVFISWIAVVTSSLYGDNLVDIQKTGVMKVGVKVDFEPFGFKTTNGKIIGFDIDIVEYIAKELGVKLELIPVTSKNRIDFLLENKVDVLAASMTHKIERDKLIDFTISYFYDGQAILAKKDFVGQSYKDFQGKTVGAVTGAASGKVFEVIQPQSKVIYYENYDLALQGLENGQVDALTSDYGFLATKAKKSNGNLKIVGRPFTMEPYGIGLRENESNLRDELNFIIQKSVKTGTYDKIYMKWFQKKPTQKPLLWP